MSLLENYIEFNNNPEHVSHHNHEKCLFDFTTNFRNLYSFEEGFKTFKKICQMSTDELSGYFNESPQKARSFVNNMMHTKLFMTKNGKRTLSAKGEVYEKFLLEKMSESDRWFINLLFVSDASFSLTANYIIDKTENIFEQWHKAGYTIGQIYNAIIYLFNIRETNMEEFLHSEYNIMVAFLNYPEFLAQYRMSSEFEKNELHEYILDNYTKGRYTCYVSDFYSPSAFLDCDTLLDDAKIVFFIHYIVNSHPISLEDLLDIFSQVYTRFFRLNNKRVMNFIMMYENVFRMTYLNLFSDMQDFYSGLKIDDKVLATTEEFSDKELNEILKDCIDYTTTESINDLVKINALLSVNAKRDAEYRCELHKENKCKYFTSKTSGKSYLEIHQLIPRDYANEFSKTIEVESNYIPLCPHCHRLIHYGSDIEKFSALAQIYQKRKERLAQDGIIPSKELLFAIYRIEQDKLKAGQNDFDKPLLEEAQPKLAAANSKKTTTKGAVIASRISKTKK